MHASDRALTRTPDCLCINLYKNAIAERQRPLLKHPRRRRRQWRRYAQSTEHAPFSIIRARRFLNHAASVEAFTMPSKELASRSHLLEFYGIECDHCVDMEPLMERLQKELGVPIRRFEVWYSDDNLRLLQKLDKKGSCGGVPFFYNKRTKGWICGATTYENLKNWALGRPHQRFLPPPKDSKGENVILKFLERVQKQAMEKMQQRMNEKNLPEKGSKVKDGKTGQGKRSGPNAGDSKNKSRDQDITDRKSSTSLQLRGKKDSN